HDVFERVQMAEQPDVLKGAADAETRKPVRTPAGDHPVVKADAAAIGAHHASDQVEQRCLAGAIRSNDRDNLAAPYREPDIRYGNEPAKPLRQPLDREHAVSSSWPGFDPAIHA